MEAINYLIMEMNLFFMCFEIKTTDFASRLRDLLDEVKRLQNRDKLTSKEVAGEMGIKPSTYSEILGGDKFPSYENLSKMIEYFTKNIPNFDPTILLSKEKPEFVYTPPILEGELEDQVRLLIKELKRLGCDSILEDIFIDTKTTYSGKNPKRGQLWQIVALKHEIDGFLLEYIDTVQKTHFADEFEDYQALNIVNMAVRLCDKDNFENSGTFSKKIINKFVHEKLDSYQKGKTYDEKNALDFIACSWLENNKKPD